MRIVIATLKSWNIEAAKKLKEIYYIKHEIWIIEHKEDLKFEQISQFSPDYIFFPHWSYTISEQIYKKYACVVFHMTDLPFGRGGSPLQNLIVRGIKETKISAIEVEQEMDAGPVYLKEDLSLDGSAEEIYRRASKIIFEQMIPQFLEKKLYAVAQQGTPVFFNRRKAAESELHENMSLEQIYDYIRMLDAEGYPNAYLIFGKYKLTFKKAQFGTEGIKAEVNIMENESCIQF